MKKELLAAAALASACDKKEQKDLTTRDQPATTAGSTAAANARLARYQGTFGPNGARPVAKGEPAPVKVPAEVVEELNTVAPERIESAFLGRKLPADADIAVRFGGPGANEGLLISIEVGGRTVSRPIPPATSPPEQVTNLDHTVERLLDELGVSRQGGAL